MRDLLPTVFKILGVGSVAAIAAGCAASTSRPESSYNSVITEEAMLTAVRTNSDNPIETAATKDCPLLQVEGGQRNVTVYEAKRIGDEASIVHRAEINKTARECQVADHLVQVKYGMAGRVVLGPKGKPGTISVPAIMQVYDKSGNKVKSDPISVSVTISRENPLAYFSLVRDVSIPLKEGAKPEDYTISLAFDKKAAGGA